VYTQKLIVPASRPEQFQVNVLKGCCHETSSLQVFIVHSLVTTLTRMSAHLALAPMDLGEFLVENR